VASAFVADYVTVAACGFSLKKIRKAARGLGHVHVHDWAGGNG